MPVFANQVSVLTDPATGRRLEALKTGFYFVDYLALDGVPCSGITTGVFARGELAAIIITIERGPRLTVLITIAHELFHVLFRLLGLPRVVDRTFDRGFTFRNHTMRRLHMA